MAANDVRVAILGISGRMGRALVTALDEARGVTLVGAACSPNGSWVGRDVSDVAGGPKRGVGIVNNARAAVGGAEVAIDFTLPDATLANLEACVAANCALVIGTTGLDVRVREQIEQGARNIPIVAAPNMSLGVNVLISLVESAARALDEAYDIEIFEAHHRNKKDAPSGTALALGQAAADGRQVAFDAVADYARHGVSGPRRSGAVGFSVFRGGDVVGDHTVTFAGVGERLELTHRASDRMGFARGAVKAVQWVAGRAPGLYSMQDVLGLRPTNDLTQ